MTARAAGGCLWLPVSSPHLAWIAALSTFVAYASTMARDLGFFDSPLLGIAAVQLGLAHPPGQPLHTLLGALLVRLLPFLPPLTVLSGLSAACGALTMVPALSLAERMIAREPHEPAARRTAAVVLIIGALHAALWEQSTRIEVYALAAFLAVWCIARFVALLEAEARGAWPWLALGVVLGLAACANPVIAVFALAACTPTALLALARKQLTVRAVGFTALGGVLGLLPYIYVPWAATRSDALVWGGPRSGTALLDYLTARDFAVNLNVPLPRFAAQLAAWLAWSYEVALLPLLAIGAVASLALSPRGGGRSTGPLATVLAVGYIAHYAIFRPEVPDYVSYVSVATWLSVAGAAGLAGHLHARGLRAGSWAVAGVLVGCALLAPPPLSTRTRSADRTARALITELTREAPAGSIFVLSSDHWVAPFMYLQEVERLRPDLVLVASGLSSSRWHWQRIYQRHPELAGFALQGPGGQVGRLARFLAAQPWRRVFVEDASLASRLGPAWCLGDVLPELSRNCSEGGTDLAAAGRTIADLTQRIDTGEPTALGVLAHVSLSRGVLLWSQGHAAVALPTLMAAVPPSWGASYELAAQAAQAGPLTAPLPRWRHEPPIGDPAQNLFVAAQLARAAGAEEQARQWLAIARDHGLAEAAADAN